MKTKKLNLNDLKVESFVTSLKENDAQTIKGGSTPICAGEVAFAFEVAAVVVTLGTIVAIVALRDGVATVVGKTTKK